MEPGQILMEKKVLYYEIVPRRKGPWLLKGEAAEIQEPWVPWPMQRDEEHHLCFGKTFAHHPGYEVTFGVVDYESMLLTAMDFRVHSPGGLKL